MPATSKQPRRLSDADLQQLLELTKGADSVELKLTVPDSERRSTVASLGMDPRTLRSARCSSSTPRTCASTRAAWSCGPAGSRAAATSPWSGSGRSSPASWPSRRGRCVTSRWRIAQGTT
jgi:hypothetical protein